MYRKNRTQVWVTDPVSDSERRGSMYIAESPAGSEEPRTAELRVLCPPVLLLKMRGKTEMGITAVSSTATPHARVPVETALFPMVLWLSLTPSVRLGYGVMKERARRQDRWGRGICPSTFSSLSYSRYHWQRFWVLVIQFGSRTVTSGKMVLVLRKTELCGLF